MMTKNSYRSRPVKRRRSTQAEMEHRREQLLDIIQAQAPMTVRQVFYQSTVRGLVEKTELAYRQIGELLVKMRKDGTLPYSWLADGTRWMRKPRTFDGVEDFLNNAASSYRKALWADADAYIEIWLEKDSLAGVIIDVTSQFDVPLMVSRGFASLSFLHSAAETIAEQGRPTYIYHCGDHDPSGVAAGEKIEETLRELSGGAEIYFERIAVTPQQIAAWNLPSRPTKTSDSRTATWTGGDSVELDAIPPDMLRALVRDAIEQHMPADELARLKRTERLERESLLDFVKAWEAQP